MKTKADAYFWVTSSEDGTHVATLTREQVEKRLADAVGNGEVLTFLDRVPDSDKGYWMHVPEYGAVLLIKGRIVQPRPVTVVQAFEVD